MTTYCCIFRLSPLLLYKYIPSCSCNVLNPYILIYDYLYCSPMYSSSLFSPVLGFLLLNADFSPSSSEEGLFIQCYLDISFIKMYALF
ncbi:hypothetical protein IEQ34_012209 [Dendrobium chrysotoxum]|uniref:Uncharacterized protein n=1 Tax=Dendrobium chrysotoxum TaxID=161865 RepID=A0AAV7GVZ0_DENCH|nr:hypothetical protein IEQ34_012209 [Dendrobium chrysotoxum]